jgi:hypothetical protein
MEHHSTNDAKKTCQNFRTIRCESKLVLRLRSEYFHIIKWNLIFLILFEKLPTTTTWLRVVPKERESSIKIHLLNP